MDIIKIQPKDDIIKKLDQAIYDEIDNRDAGEIIGSLIALTMFQCVYLGIPKDQLLSIIGNVYDLEEELKVKQIKNEKTLH